MKIELIETMLTGHPEIDADHARIVELVNEIAPVPGGTNAPLRADLMTELLQTCRDHFHREEDILKALDYPEWDAHKAYHRKLLTKAETAAAKYVGEMTDMDRIACFEDMALFLIDDVVRGDTSFVSFLADRGVTTPQD